MNMMREYDLLPHEAIQLNHDKTYRLLNLSLNKAPYKKTKNELFFNVFDLTMDLLRIGDTLYEEIKEL